MVHEEKSTLNHLSPSPVAFYKNTKWQARLLIMIAFLVLIGGVELQHWMKPKQEVGDEETSSAPIVSAPQLTPVDQQLAQIEESLATKQAKTSSTMSQSVDHMMSEADEEAEKLEKMRMVAPTTVYSTSNDNASSSVNGASNTENGVLGGTGSGDVNSQFMSQVSHSGVPVIEATHIAHPSTTLAQGTMIWATLETRIASDLPGLTRAVTSEDIYSEDGAQVLLPKGSRLIGQYTNAISQGQQRVFVVWQRVIRPDHISIQLNSAGTDALGGAGIGADAIDRHFLAQFGTAALLSIISAGAANVDVGSQDQLNSASAYREALANSFAQTAQNTLRSTGTINPTLYINQGKAISVFVSRDLDFDREFNRMQGAL